jgi:hypothetical protein
MAWPKRPFASNSARCLVLAVIGLLQSCVVVPRSTNSYDRECKVVAKHMELEVVQVGSLMGCGGADCGYLLALAGATAAASAVISGSIAIVGNVVYWLEKQGQCLKPTPT